jgi:hypothetical protein
MDNIKVITIGLAATGLFLYLLSNSKSFVIYKKGKNAMRNYRELK